MHRTTTTIVSDAITALVQLRERIDGDDFNWMDATEQFVVVVGGMGIMHQLTSEYSPDQFDVDEVQFIDELAGECEDILQELIIVNEDLPDQF